MNRSLPPMLSCLLLLAAGLIAPVVQARDATDPVRMRESVSRAERETGGKVLRAEHVRRGDRDIYRLKVLTPEGRVRVMQDEQRRPLRASSLGPAAEAREARGNSRSELPARREALAPRNRRGDD
jgi:hypothetical protein